MQAYIRMVESSVDSTIKNLFQDRDFLEVMFGGDKHCTIIGNGSSMYGIRRSFLGVSFEYYTGDQEPVVERVTGLRVVIWRTMSRITTPQGWYVGARKSKGTVYAFVDIRNKESYVMEWKRTFRNYVHQWKKQTTYLIKKVDSQSFKNMYCQFSGAAFSSISAHGLARNASLPNVSASYYVLFEKQNEEAVAGVSTIDFLASGQSYYYAAFTRKDIAPPQAGLWLCNIWAQESSAKGVEYLNLGGIISDSSPRSWKGFSDFKVKFNPKYRILAKDFFRVTFSARYPK